jgi:hypothetical protein
MSPSDKFVNTDKDNVFTAFKWATVDKMMFFNRQQLQFEYETEWGLKTTAGVKLEGNEAAGRLFYNPLSTGTTLPSPKVDEGDMLHMVK